MKWALDGYWIGATQANRDFYISVDPGEHHLCSEWQTAVILTAGHPAPPAHFTAVAGQVYYFRTENYFWKETGVTNVKLGQLGSDEALLLMSKFGFSESKPKK